MNALDRLAQQPRHRELGHAGRKRRALVLHRVGDDQLLQQAQQMQQQLMAAQEELGAATVEGSAGGGLVKVTVSGRGEIVDIAIDPGAIDADVPAMT